MKYLNLNNSILWPRKGHFVQFLLPWFRFIQMERILNDHFVDSILRQHPSPRWKFSAIDHSNMVDGRLIAEGSHSLLLPLDVIL